MTIHFKQTRFLSFLAVFTFLSCTNTEKAPEAEAQNSEANNPAKVIAVVDAFHAALVAGDSITALNYLAEDVAILESGGAETKSHYRSGHLLGDMRFAQALPRKRNEMAVNIMGDVAWAHSTNTTQGKMGDREINSQGAELVVLARKDDSWVIKAIHWSSRRIRKPKE
ncbi:MAG: nuclear transport factor 2 family protein [Flavobacteriaceae bacterium]|nr:nuclear transport factor 2 family protein [Flavobacteriaceae bacterium]